MSAWTWTMVDGEYQRVPNTTKTGLPAHNDVIGRFLAGMKGRSGNFYTDGDRIYSYRDSYPLLERDILGDIRYCEQMFGKPYSSSTSSHMWDVRNEHRLDGLVVNDNVESVPLRLIEQGAKYLVQCAFDGDAASAVADGLHGTFFLHQPTEKVFKVARRLLAEKQGGIGRDTKAYYRACTKQSVDAAVAREEERKAVAGKYLDAYEARIAATEYPPPRMPRLVMPPELHPVPKASVQRGGAKVDKRGGVLGWHFAHNTWFEHGDGREIVVGETVSIPDHKGVVICACGFHASAKMHDARGYNSGYVLTRVHISGDVQFNEDKFCGRHRTTLGMVSLGDPGNEEIYRAVKHGYFAEAETLALAAMGLTKGATEAPQREVAA